MMKCRVLLLLFFVGVFTGCISVGEKTDVKYVDWTIGLPGNRSIVCYEICEKSLLLMRNQIKGYEIILYDENNVKEAEGRQPLLDGYVTAYCYSDQVIGVCMAEDYSNSKLWKSTDRKYVLIQVNTGLLTVYDRQIDIESILCNLYAFDSVEWIFTNVRPAEAIR